MFLTPLLISFTASSAYTDMVIEGVKQSNGVWTTAGVMDTQGFVRTTGAVTVAGATRNLPVTLAADISASSKILKVAARSAGPIALAAAAYDVYDWINSDPDIDSQGNNWVQADGEVESFGNYWTTLSPSNVQCGASSPNAAAICTQDKYNVLDPKNPPWYHSASCSTPTASSDVWCVIKTRAASGATIEFSARRSKCTTQTYSSCRDAVYADDNWFDTKLGQAPIPIIISGWNHIPSLSGQPTPIKSTSFTPFSEWMSDPYFKDGNWWRDRMDVSPAPLPGQPTRVRIDVGPVKLEGQTDPNTPPVTGPAGGNTQEKEKPSFCEENPQSIACAQMGELEPEELDSTELPISLNTPAWGSDNSQCPAPVTGHDHMGKTFTISFQPTCDFLEILRPIIIACAWLAAIYILLGLRKQGEGES